VYVVILKHCIPFSTAIQGIQSKLFDFAILHYNRFHPRKGDVVLIAIFKYAVT
jgi:hypothetical protein